MRIANYGGAIISENGDMNFPGSGGMVGGLSAPGKGNSYLGGAGAEYQIFTPSNGPRPRITFPGGGSMDPPTTADQPPIYVEPGSGTGGTGGTGTPGGPTVINPPVGTTPTPGGTVVPPNSTMQDPFSAGPTTGTPNATIIEIVRNLMGRTREQVTGSGPVYLFAPQPGGESNGGFAMKQILVLGALAFGGFWLYKKYAA